MVGPIIKCTRLLTYASRCDIYNSTHYCLLSGMSQNVIAVACGLKRNYYFSSLLSPFIYPSTLRSISHFIGTVNHKAVLGKRFLQSSTRHNQNRFSNDASKPIILYVQNPFRWILNKLDFGMLRKAWDPDFRENDFKIGAKFAISSITQILSCSEFGKLSGLLTSPAISSLRYEVETKWTDVQRRNVTLNVEDIKVVLPQRVRFQRIGEKKFCDIDVVFLALKQSKYEGVNATIFMEIKARFHRDYTEGLLPDWTVSMFKVTRFNVLPR